jgi:hypothetical protein
MNGPTPQEGGSSRRFAVGVMRASARIWRRDVLDLMFVAITLGFFGLSIGYAAFCDRL